MCVHVLNDGQGTFWRPLELTKCILVVSFRDTRTMYFGHAHTFLQPMDGEEMPPPLPMKQKQRRHGTSVGSPQHTPTHHSHSLSSPVSTPYHSSLGYNADSLARSFGTSSYYRGSGSSDSFEGEQYQPPPVPMRMESIPGVKSVLVQDTPPPKPPRTDVYVPNAVPQVHLLTHLLTHTLSLSLSLSLSPSLPLFLAFSSLSLNYT